MKKNIKKQKYYSNIYKNNEKNIILLKCLSNNLILDINDRNYYATKLDSIIRSTNKHKIRHVCIKSGRGRGIIKKYKISRFYFKKYINLGLLPGIKNK